MTLVSGEAISVFIEEELWKARFFSSVRRKKGRKEKREKHQRGV